MKDRIRPGSTPPHLVVTHVRAQAFVPLTRNILAKLGFALLDPGDWAESPIYGAWTPHLRIADEVGLGEIAREGAGCERILLLTGSKGVQTDDPRVIGAIHKPAGLHELHQVLQRELSDTPRSVMRLSTDLEAHVKRAGHTCQASVRSISEQGCLLRSSEPLPLGADLEVGFGLPGKGWVELRAASTYQLPPDTGLVFEPVPPTLRAAIAEFVEDGLGRV